MRHTGILFKSLLTVRKCRKTAGEVGEAMREGGLFKRSRVSKALQLGFCSFEAEAQGVAPGPAPSPQQT